MAKTVEHRTQMLLQGVSCFKILELMEGKPYQQARLRLLRTQK